MGVVIQRRELGGFELKLWRLFFEIRIGGMVALGLIALLPFTDVDGSVGVFILGVIIPGNVAMRELLSRLRFVPWWLPAVDSAASAAAIVIQPDLVPIVLMVLLGSAAQAAAAGWRPTVLATMLGMPFLVAAATLGDFTANITHFLIYLSLSTGITVFVARIADAERRGRQGREQLLDGIDALVWEAHPYPFVAASFAGNVEKTLGLDHASLSGTGSWLSRVPASDRAALVRRSHEAIDAGRSHELTYRIANADGELRYVRDRVSVVVDSHGRPVTARGVVVDITDDIEVRASNRNLAELVEHVPVGLVVARAEQAPRFRTITVNPAFEQLAGRSAADLLDTCLPRSLDGPGATEIQEIMNEVRDTGLPQHRAEAGDLRSGGERVLSLEAFPISEDLVGLNVVDVTDRVNTARKLQHQALHDGLTGLPNRALLEDRLRHGIDAARRDGSPVALLMLDLNQFKEVNDTLGHDQGDRLLRMVGDRLRDSLRAVDTVARLGGDEFAILLTDDVSPRRTLRAAERVLACFDEPHDIDGMSLQCGVSLGVAIYPEHGETAEALRKHADIAMYVAKRRGGGVAIYDPERDHPNLNRLTLVGQLRNAINNDELELHYQPVIDLASARVVKVEALVRWNHSERGLIGPGEFIDVAEVSGVIGPLTQWVVKSATADACSFHAEGHPVDLAVNVSVRNLYEPAFVNSVQDALVLAGLDGSRVTIELTESQMMDDPLLTHAVLTRLRTIGVRGSVDDFGTGRSSLSSLQSLPVSEIKIDKSFIGAMGNGDDAAATIVKAMVSLGKNLGLDVVAEGVETAEAMTTLSMLGCDYAQGYLFAHPMPRKELLEYLETSRQGVSF